MMVRAVCVMFIEREHVRNGLDRVVCVMGCEDKVFLEVYLTPELVARLQKSPPDV